MKRKIFRCGIAMIVAMSFLVSHLMPLAAAEQTANGDSLAEQLQKKYAQEEKYTYGDPIYDLKRDEAIVIDLGFDAKEKGMEYYTEIACLYKDAELTQAVGNSFERSEDKTKLSLEPPRRGDLRINNSGLARDEYGMEDSEYTLFEKEEFKDWGNLGKLYMAIYVDLETGEPLKKPEVRIVTIAGELAAPRIKFIENEEGIAAFSWEEVEGAKKYLVVQINRDEKYGLNSMATVIGETTDTYWESEVLKGDNIINSTFRTFTVSEDDWGDENMLDYYLEKHGEEAKGTVVRSDYESRDSYGVIAINEKGTSMVSNTYTDDEIAPLLVYEEAYYTVGDERKKAVSNFTEVPSYRWVVMCDGRLMQKLVAYDISKAGEDTERWATYEDEENYSDIEFYDKEIVKIPYQIEGTPFEAYLTVEEYDKATFESELSALADRQDGLKSRTGNVETQAIQITDEARKGATLKRPEPEEQTEQEEQTEKEEQKKPAKANARTMITANSALSEYLATHMVEGEEEIDLSDFKESTDEDYLMDAVLEARYQNPFVLGIENMWLSVDRKTLTIEYEDKQADREKKQKELVEAAEEVVEEIITEEMSDLEKEMAINQYLCDIAEYDYEALENAAEYDYKYVDEEYYDSFTAYGVLINKVGVCASYSAAFKLLSDQAGLESIVVTGYLDGSLAHAWNRVKVEGEWRTIDVTNNDNEELPNALLNLSDNAAKRVLIEDETYAMDGALPLYTSSDDELEYYRMQGRYFETDKVAAELAANLDKDGVAILRTDYDLNDSSFKEILVATSEKATKKPTSGYYWMGVIYLNAN